VDFKAGRGDARRIGESKVTLVSKRLCRLNLKFSRAWVLVKKEGSFLEVAALPLRRIRH
jgi:hypothetical protein